MGLQLSRDIALADVPQDWSTFTLGGTDRIDIRAKGNPVKLELQGLPMQPWSDAIVIDSDDFESISGLAIAYPAKGVYAFRLSNGTPGKPATVTLRAYSVG